MLAHGPCLAHAFHAAGKMADIISWSARATQDPQDPRSTSLESGVAQLFRDFEVQTLPVTVVAVP
jgi:hypothetical protein